MILFGPICLSGIKVLSKKLKPTSVNIDPLRPNYKYRYVLQKRQKKHRSLLFTPQSGKESCQMNQRFRQKFYMIQAIPW